MIKPGQAPDYRDRNVKRIPLAKPESERALVRGRSSAVKPVESELETCERQITQGFDLFTAGFAKIKNKHLYKEAGFANFTDYCQEKWGFSRDRGYQILAAENVMKTLGPKCRPLVRDERAARALSSIPAGEREKVVRAVSKTGPVTARRIAEASKTEETIDAEVVETKPTNRVHDCPWCACKGE
jgi:hypothetical protein